MSDKIAKRRADLRTRIIDAAEATILADGISAVKARDLAKTAGCALGAIYNVFDDMTHIVLEVNGRTFKRLGVFIADALAAQAPQPPRDALITMAKAYLQFAADNKRAWRTLFDLEMSTEQDVPEWYMTELGQLFALIAAPLRALRPELSREEIAVLTRALFSSVHGIVLLGLEQRISGVPLPEIEHMIEVVLISFSEPPSKI